jgi:hypothetical protein
MIQELETKIMTKKRFSKAVEEIVHKQSTTYIDAITYVVEERGMDYSNIKKLLSESLLAKLTAEASSKRLINVDSGNTLPL